MFPGFIEYATLGGNVDLRAQVRDTSVSSISWDTSHLGLANNITGTNTYRLQFQWATSGLQTPQTESVTLTVTNTNNQSEQFTYSFVVPTGTNATAGTGTATWPQALSPDTVLSSADSFPTHNASVDANSGALDATIALPSYNPNVPALALTYDSLAADPRPIIVEHHQIDDSQSVPSQVSGQLTLNGTAGTTWYYNTSGFIPGDIQQLALQADATSLSTGRYNYTITIGDIRGSTTTTTVNGSATVLNNAASAFGDGWTLQGLERITTATGGVILDLGTGGKSLWFTGSFGSGGGTYTDPAGEFSTLTLNGDGTYTRTLTDGTKINFNSTSQEVATVDRNGLRVTYAYDSGGKLSTIKDPYGNTTSFAYDGNNRLSTVTDPAGRVATFTHTGANLTGVTLPDSSTWGYGYDGSGRMTQVTDPNSKTVTVSYDSAERVSPVTRPDSSVETFTPYQERGWTNSGTSGSPAAPTLLAEARSTYTDPLSNVTDLRPDWNGQGLTDVTVDPSGNVSTADRDANGLATISIDPLNRVTQTKYDAKGNAVTITYPTLDTDQYTYNSFSEPLTHTDVLNHTTSYTYDGNGNETVVEDPMLNLTTMTYTADGKLATVKDARLNVTCAPTVIRAVIRGQKTGAIRLLVT
jgi:YD repeat-containing protein